MKYALASQRKIRLADAWKVDNKLSIIETINELMTAEALQNLCHVPENKNIRYRAMRNNAQSLSSLPRNALVPKLHSFFVPLPYRALSNSVVICVSRAFCSMDQEKRETARSLCRRALAWNSAVPPQIRSSLSFARKSVNDCVMWARVYDGLTKRETVRCLTAVPGWGGVGGYCHMWAT